MLLYKKFEIEQQTLSAIRNEVLENIESCLIFIDKNKPQFVPCDTEKLKALCPALCSYLESRDLLERWKRTACVKMRPHSSLVPHIDNPNIPERKWAINIPIKNCENSYTVFYSAPQKVIDKKRDRNAHGNLVQKIEFSPDEITEIDRVESDVPYYCNTKIIHSGANPTNDVRILLSLRFEPDIDDIVLTSA